jgi:hypothetical protein
MALTLRHRRAAGKSRLRSSEWGRRLRAAPFDPGAAAQAP